ncbi:hypothetical protein [Derxia gummosa]|uniref:Uncharacterized protein n=1 Tax=Derxia gummosa DSM 723 TaxID=1121388 RepID=A0A9U5G6I8_9BURK|nr:hypothetical protein [Derxia gummosa]
MHARASPPPMANKIDNRPAMFVAALLANFFEAGHAIQVLIGDMTREQYFASRLARPSIQKHLATMVESAKALPQETRDELAKVDWQAWIDLGAMLDCSTRDKRDAVWIAIEKWLPPTGLYLRQYRAKKPELFQFRLG